MLVVAYRLETELDATSFGSGDTFSLTLTDKVAFGLGESRIICKLGRVGKFKLSVTRNSFD